MSSGRIPQDRYEYRNTTHGSPSRKGRALHALGREEMISSGMERMTLVSASQQAA
jgi:hypothetical protein